MGTNDSDLLRVAVIGMAGRFPGAPDVESLWRLVCSGEEGISRFPPEVLAAERVDDGVREGADYVPVKGVVQDADCFDATFFGVNPREAQLLDPQHRVLLECAWHALEDAGLTDLDADVRVGVFAGASLNTYLLRNLSTNPGLVESVGNYQTLLASDKDFLATRIAYKLGLTGPAITVQTACSTSLTAVHLACQSLLAGECDIALAGGVSVTAPLQAGYRHEPGGILSPDGHCRPFDAAARGTVPGNGVGLVVLRRLGEARAAGDRVDAVILGSAVNNDGAAKVGYTAPSVDGQAAVIAEALAVSGIHPGTVGVIEAHGTGTPLGDPIECAALTEAYAGAAPGSIAIGSIKGTVGHLDAAAGVAGLIKAVLQVREGRIAPVVGFSSPNPELGLDGGPLRIADRLVDWDSPEPRRAAVSSFGMGGTNVHVVLEQGEGPARPAPMNGAEGGTIGAQGAPGSDGHAGPELALMLSARSPEALRRNAAALADRLEADPAAGVPAPTLADVSATLAHRRRRLDRRWGAVVDSPAQAVTALRELAGATGTAPGARGAGGTAVVTARSRARAAFLFPGQGAQYAGMAAQLYAAEAAVRETVDRCAELFEPELDEDLRELVFGSGADVDQRLTQTRITQPAVFLVDLALAQAWRARGIEPAALVGHSIGEYVAAQVAGVMTLEEAVRLVAARGRLIQGLPSGAMVSVALDEEAIGDWLAPGLDLAAVNSTGQCVLSGSTEAIAEVADRLAVARIAHRRLSTSHAFHSAAMEPAVDSLVELARGVDLRPPRIPFVSNVTGDWITPQEATDPGYWGRHLRAPVRFADAIRRLLADPDLIPVEVGPGTTLTGLITAHADWDGTRSAISSLGRPRGEHGDVRRFRSARVMAWAHGLVPDLADILPAPRPPVRLPGYRFARDRHWVQPGAAVATVTGQDRRPAGPVLSQRTWRRVALTGPTVPEAPGGSRSWLVLAAADPRSEAMAAELTALLADASGATPQLLPLAEASAVADILAAHDPAERLRVIVVAVPGADTPAALRRAPAAGLLGIVQLLAAHRPVVRCCIDVITDGLHAVTGQERIEPLRALLVGPVVVGPHEVSGLSTRLLDVGPDPAEQPAAAGLGRIVDALAADPPERELALRGRHWWAPRIDPLETTDGPSRLRDGGCYLITGGLGGVGMALAGHIAASVEEPVLVLASRHADGLDPATDAAIEGLRRQRATVLVRALDVADEDAVAALVATVEAGYGPLSGIIHAAGMPAGGPLTGLTVERSAAVLAPKVDGTVALWRAARGDRLDLFVVCSSVTALLGGPGQLDYCAANAVAEATVAAFGEQARGAVSIGWGTWRATGMAAGRAQRGVGRPTAHPLLHAVSSEPGAATYAARFATDRDWVVADHRLMGHGLVPGTAYLDLALAAVRDATGHDGVVELSEILFLSPLVVPDGTPREVTLVLTAVEAGWAVSVRSGGPGAGSVEHARVTARLAPAAPSRVVDLDRLLAGCAVTEDLTTEAQFRERLRTSRFEKGAGPLQFSFGPRWQTLRRIRTGGARMLATLELPEEYAADLTGFPLHPALVDLAGGLFRIHAPESHYLPLAYRRVRVESPLTTTVLVHVQIDSPDDMSGETIGCDMTLLGPDGTVLVEISGFRIKRINDVEGLAHHIETVLAGTTGPGSSGIGGSEADGLLGPLTASMSVPEALAAFDQIVRARRLPGHVDVFPGDLAAAISASRALTPEVLAERAAALTPAPGAHARPELSTPFVAPRTDLERQVAAVWQEVLGLAEVGVDDDFFAVGGHSLAAVQIGTRLQQTLGVELDLGAFFESPTVAAAAAAIAARAEGPTDRIPVLDRAETWPAREGVAATGAEELGGLGFDVVDGLDGLDGLDIEALSDAEVEAHLAALLRTDPSWPNGAASADGLSGGERR